MSAPTYQDQNSFYHKGKRLQNKGQLQEAANYYTRLLEGQPQNVQLKIAMAQVLFQQNKLRQACRHLENVIELQPESALAHSNLGYILYLLGESSQAENACMEAIRLSPDFVDALCNLGVVLISQGRYEQAHSSLLKAACLKPDSALVWTNLAIVLLQCGRLSDSISASHKALHLNGQKAETYCNLGMALQEKMQHKEALKAYTKALELQPYHPAAQSNHLMCLQYIPQKSSGELRTATASFTLNMPSLPAKRTTNTRKQRLHIGYVSGDFKRHPVGWFLQSILHAHDRGKIEISCYDTANRPDEVTAALQANADHWCLLHNKTDSEAATRIMTDNIDILVDLAGHTAGNRLGIFELKPAPLQVSWLGYFASTGLDAMDYIFLGADQAPDGNEAFFHEKLFRLQQCQFLYTPPEYAPPVSDPPHLQNSNLTFGCFNNTAKLNHDVLTLWSQLLQQVPNSRLVLKWKSFADQLFVQEIKDFFSWKGVTSSRIELRGASNHRTMLSEYGDIDIALDPFPFSGALTTSEALWMGVPVITFAGLRPVSRQSAAILNNLGLPELIAYTYDKYLTNARELAHNSKQLTQLRSSLRRRMTDTMPRSADSLVSELEKAFFSVYKKYYDHI